MRILAFDKGGVKEFDSQSLEEALQYQTVWIDLINPSNMELQLIQEKFNLHPLAIEDVIHKGQRPKIEEYENNLFTILHAFKRIKGRIQKEEIFLFLGDKWLISIHDSNPIMVEAFTRVLKTAIPRLLTQSPISIYYFIIDKIVSSYFVFVEETEDKIVKLEERMEERLTRKILHEMDSLRRFFAYFRRSLWPTREMIGNIVRGVYPLISSENIPYFRDVYDDLLRLIEFTDGGYQRVDSIHNLYLSLISTSTNEIVKIFTVLTVLFMPPTLVAAIYGMNFPHIPELKWEFGYYFALTLMFLAAVIPLIYIKKKHII
jgi:magnesium transporter